MSVSPIKSQEGTKMGLVKNANGNYQIDSHTVLDYELAYYRLIALVNVLQDVDLDMVSKDDIYYTCSMIKDLISSLDDFMILNRYYNKN